MDRRPASIYPAGQASRVLCVQCTSSPVGRGEHQIKEKQKEKSMHKGPCVQVCGLLHANSTRLRQQAAAACCP